MKKKWYIISLQKITEFLFFLAFGVYLLFTILSTSFYASYLPNGYMKMVVIFCIIILLFKELLHKKTSYKEVVYLILFAFLSILILYHLNKTSMIPFFLLIYSARKIKFDKIAKFALIETSILLFVIIISAKLGLILNYVSNGTRKREYLGFLYALYPQMFMFNITSLYLYITRDRKSMHGYIFLIIINTLIFIYTDSRLSFYLSILLIFSIFLLKIKPNILENKRIICFIMSSSFIIFSLLSIFVIMNYDSSNVTMRKLDDFLGNRLSLGYNSLSTYPITLLGNDVEFIGNGLTSEGTKVEGEYNYVDCFYLNILEKYGIIFFILILFLLTYTSFKVWKNKDYYLLIILFAIALHNVIDDLGINIYFNTFWLIIGEYVTLKKSKNINN